MVKSIVLLVAALIASAIAYPSVKNNSPAARIVRAAFANPEHFDRVHCLPHEDHVDCHIDHYDTYTDYNGYPSAPGPDLYPPIYAPTNSPSGKSYADTSAKSFAINTPLGGISFSDAQAHSGTRNGGLLGAIFD